MAFSPEEKVWIRFHMGYLQVTSVATFALGVPAAVETQFMIEHAMNLIPVAAEGLVRDHLVKLSTILEQMVADHELLAIERLGEITINLSEHDKLRKEYQFWQRSLGNCFGIEPNHYDQRFHGQGINVPVVH